MSHPRPATLPEDDGAAANPGARRPHAVVIGLDCSTGVQTARLLARNDVPVIGIAADRRHPSARTNVCERVVEAPTSGPRLLDALDALAPAAPGGVLYPCTDASVLTLAGHREGLQGTYRVVLPGIDVIRTLMSKDAFAEHAAAHGLPVPRARVVADASQIEPAGLALRFPCVVKPSLRTPAWETAGPKVHVLPDATAWRERAPDLLELASPLVLQEWVTGSDADLYSCNCYISPHGVPIVTFVARKIRQWPPHAGTSSLGEAVPDDRIRDLALRTLSTLPFHGLGYVEIKRDPTTGTDVILEVNVGRPTGRSAIAEAAGVELLYTMYCDEVGLPLPPGRMQRDRPIKWVHLGRDLRSALAYWRAGELTFGEWRASMRGPKVYADLDLRDPRPLVYEVLHGLRAVLRGYGARLVRLLGERAGRGPA